MPDRSEIKAFDDQTIRTLAAAQDGDQDGKLVSIYFPTHHAGPQVQQNQIRLKNLIATADRQLEQRRLDAATRQALLAPARALLEKVDVWQLDKRGIALFLSADVSAYGSLPFAPRETLLIGSRFYCKPLLSKRNASPEYFLLGLSQKRTTLWRRQGDQLTEIDLPQDLASAGDIYPNVETEPQQVRRAQPSFTPGSRANGQQMLHGHGGGGAADEKQLRAAEYIHVLGKTVSDMLQDESAPLLVTCVEYLFPIFREACSYPHLMERQIAGSPDRSRQELLAEADQIIENELNRKLHAVYQDWLERRASDFTVSDPVVAANAAFQGRVASVFLHTDDQRWVVIRERNGLLEISDANEGAGEDLYNFIACHTYLGGGIVYPFEQITAAEDGQAAGNQQAIAASLRAPVSAVLPAVANA